MRGGLLIPRLGLGERERGRSWYCRGGVRFGDGRDTLTCETSVFRSFGRSLPLAGEKRVVSRSRSDGLYRSLPLSLGLSGSLI